MYTYLTISLLIYLLSYLFYRFVSHGLGHKAEYLQMRRFIPCALLATLPCYIAGIDLLSSQTIISLITGLFWIITYPLLYFFTYHKTSTDFGFHFDAVFGMYIISWLLSLKFLVTAFNIFPKALLLIISNY